MRDGSFNLDIVSRCPAMCHFHFAKKKKKRKKDAAPGPSIHWLAPVTDSHNDWGTKAF